MTAGPNVATKYHNPDTGLTYMMRGMHVPSQAALDLFDALDQAGVRDDPTIDEATAALTAAEVQVDDPADLLNCLNFRRQLGPKYRQAVTAGWFLQWSS